MARAKRVPYTAGTWFAVPLLDGLGWARGIAARTTSDGCVLGYFFGPKSETLPPLESCLKLSARDAKFQALFGDPGLLTGEWPILGPQPEFRRENWPVPGFVYRDIISRKPRLRNYDDETLEMVSEVTLSDDDSHLYADDGVYGYVALQIRLSREFG